MKYFRSEKRINMSKKWVLIIFITILISIFFFLIYINNTFREKVLLMVMYEDTTYAKDYSEENFFKIKKGMTKEEVKKILGEPLFKTENNNYWHYSWYGNGTGNHLTRLIIFGKDGKVERIERDFYLD